MLDVYLVCLAASSLRCRRPRTRTRTRTLQSTTLTWHLIIALHDFTRPKEFKEDRQRREGQGRHMHVDPVEEPGSSKQRI